VFLLPLFGKSQCDGVLSHSFLIIAGKKIIPEEWPCFSGVKPDHLMAKVTGKALDKSM